MVKAASQILEGIAWPSKPRMRNPAKHSPLLLQNRLQMEVVGPDGVRKQRVDARGNIMVTWGLNHLIEVLSSGTDSASEYANYMVLGTGSVAAASDDASLGASTQTQHSFSQSDQGAMTVRYLGTFSSDGNASQIREVGIFNTNTYTGSMICRKDLTGTQSVNRGASDEIRVSYDIIASTG